MNFSHTNILVTKILGVLPCTPDAARIVYTIGKNPVKKVQFFKGSYPQFRIKGLKINQGFFSEIVF